MKGNNLETFWERRDRLKIMAEIMEVAKGGKLKTRIMYMVNLSFSQVNEYLSFLTEMGFLSVRVDNGRKIYETTTKGKSFIENYMDMAKLLNTEELVRVPILAK